ncbi:MarR family transcriptional regulator [Streptacidiphilus rugosus]|uniref:MarR family transcriptional regulator n=1 Tax=Streptacidiphilus rugosus TaxID=405783 RepID=UPI00056C9AA9|nr:MarR family transcriptional regulator [Streptacidiphilus rugosus]
MTRNTAPDTPDGLTPAAARIYAALHVAPGSTAAELSRTASAGLSTTGKLLKQMEQDGLARRTPGGSEGNRRLPDHWQTTATSPDPETTNLPDQTDATTASAPSLAPDDATAFSDAQSHSEPACPEQQLEQASSGTDEASPVEATETEPQPTPEPSAEPPTGRLGQGGLRNLVHGYLADRPGAAHSPTRIARQLGRSSGAVANALVTLVNQGEAEMVTAKPRTYRATSASTQD